MEDFGARFDGAPDLEFRMATQALEFEESGLSYQRIMVLSTRVSESGEIPAIADVAQLVEHFTRNEGVPGSSPGVGFE